MQNLESTQSFQAALLALQSIREKQGNTNDVKALAQFLFDAAPCVFPPSPGLVVGELSQENEDMWDE